MKNGSEIRHIYNFKFTILINIAFPLVVEVRIMGSSAGLAAFARLLVDIRSLAVAIKAILKRIALERIVD